MNHHHHYRRRASNPFGCAVFLLAVFLFTFFQELNYSNWIPAIIVILILGSCIMTAIARRKKNQVAANALIPPSQTNPSLSINPNYNNPAQISPRSDIQYQPSQSTATPPQQMRKLCPMCGAQLDDEILKQLIIANRAYCKFCGNQIQK